MGVRGLGRRSPAEEGHTRCQCLLALQGRSSRSCVPLSWFPTCLRGRGCCRSCRGFGALRHTLTSHRGGGGCSGTSPALGLAPWWNRAGENVSSFRGASAAPVLLREGVLHRWWGLEGGGSSPWLSVLGTVILKTELRCLAPKDL